MKLVLFFDIDGTLIDSAGAGRAALEWAVRELYGREMPASIEFRGRTDRAIAGEIFAGLDVQDSAENWRTLAEAYQGRLQQCLHDLPGRVLQGVDEWLRRLSRRDDVALGLITGNGKIAAETKLAHFGLFDYFAFGGYGDHHHFRADVARQALAEARTAMADAPWELSRSWVIGDTPEDIRCARAIGVRVAAVCTGGYTAAELAHENPDLLLQDLQAAADFL